jgi:hypothetical protein
VERRDIRSLRVKHLLAIKAYREDDDEDDNDDNTSESTVSCDNHDELQGGGPIVSDRE